MEDDAFLDYICNAPICVGYIFERRSEGHRRNAPCHDLRCSGPFGRPVAGHKLSVPAKVTNGVRLAPLND